MVKARDIKTDINRPAYDECLVSLSACAQRRLSALLLNPEIY